ncbi:lysylphosphatidylglycerol synthase transmembrane domain-containing protein [Anaeromicropila herbilytica]|uniref:Phosphatidylglycerol lysyltransferase n=1 Tax=Anaeromicropila herbilytica TaxID=2785025 RepID=A0A7R7IAZ0_9FIRM|nr:lysylphosphatidylglycerol synthase transmembrane domain-containing protein [Anaeromicropila herbilytica]BCN28972.1 phosphatidylglycerol lysyltransferase [Anaeromicropila herbilytica]
MKNNKINALIIIGSFVLLIGYLLLMDNPKDLLNAFMSAQFEHLLLALACICLYWLLESLILKNISRTQSKKLSTFACLRTTMVGQLFNCITPFQSGGQPVQAMLLAKYDVPIGEASCILLTKFIVYQTILTFYSFFVLLFRLQFFVTHVSGFTLLVLVGFLIHILVVAFLIGIGFFPNSTKKILIKIIHFLHKIKVIKNITKTINKLDNELDGFYSNFKILKKNLKTLLLPSILTVLQLTAFFVIPYFVCFSLGVTNISLFDVICASAFVLMITSFIPTPGGFGGAEGSFYLIFRVFFPKVALLAIAIILWRVFTFYLPIIVGIFFTKILYRSKEDKASIV